MKKRIFSLMLALCLIISLMPMTARAEDSSGYCGDTVTWQYDEYMRELYVVTGSDAEEMGVMYDYGTEEHPSAPWADFEMTNGEILIAYITRIGSYAFLNTHADRISIIDDEEVEGVKEIGAFAFAGCNADHVFIPDSVTLIEPYALGYDMDGDTPVLREDFLILGGAGSAAQAYAQENGIKFMETPAHGACGDNLSWTMELVSTGEGTSQYVLTISGEGEMYDYTEENKAPWYFLREYIQQVVVEEGVTSIGNYAFYGTTVSEHPQYECTSYTNLWNRVELPKSLKRIGAYAFVSLPGSSIPISAGVKNIGEKAFGWKMEDGALTADHSFTIIGEAGSAAETYALENGLVFEYSTPYEGTTARGICGENLTWVLTEDGTLTISGQGDLTCAPWDAYMEAIYRLYVEEGVTSIWGFSGHLNSAAMGDEAYSFWSLSEVRLPNTLRKISARAFYTCTSLKEITIPASVVEIGEKALGYWIGNSGFDTSEGKVSDFTIKGYAGSEAERYAIENEFAFVEIDDTTPEPTDPVPTEPTEPAPTDPEPTDPTDPEPIENPFTDVKSSDYFFEPVLWAVENGITSGVSATRFAPSDPCTRAQVVTFLWRAAGEPQPASNKNPFKDVKSTAYYYDAVLWAVEQGITTGMSATSFGPNSPCTRGQVVTFLHRAAGAPEPESEKNPFSDVKKTGFYYDAVLWAVENGITTGTSATRFSPGQTCTRGQVVTFLYRAD